MHLHTLTIDTTLSQKEAFSRIVNLANMKKWSTQTKEVKPISEGEMQEGFEFKAGDGKRLYDYVVTEYKPHSRFKFEEKGGVGFAGTITFAKNDRGTTITFVQEARDSVLLLVMYPIVKIMMYRMNAKDRVAMNKLLT